MNESFHVKDEDVYWGQSFAFAIYADDQRATQALCDLLEATRQMDVARSDAGVFSLAAAAQESAWRRLCELLMPDEEAP